MFHAVVSGQLVRAAMRSTEQVEKRAEFVVEVTEEPANEWLASGMLHA